MIHELGELRSSDGSTLLKVWKVSVQPGVRHSHIRFEITLITSGRGIYTVGDMENTLLNRIVYLYLQATSSTALPRWTKTGLK